MKYYLPTILIVAVLIWRCTEPNSTSETPHPLQGMSGIQDAHSVELRKGVNLAWGRHSADGSIQVLMIVDGEQALQLQVFGNGFQTVLNAPNAGTLVANLNRTNDGKSTIDMVRVSVMPNGQKEIRTYDQSGNLIDVKMK